MLGHGILHLRLAQALKPSFFLVRETGGSGKKRVVLLFCEGENTMGMSSYPECIKNARVRKGMKKREDSCSSRFGNGQILFYFGN